MTIQTQHSLIEQVVLPNVRDLGGFDPDVLRSLLRRPAIGSWGLLSPFGEHIERAVYVVAGEVEVVGQMGRFGGDQLVLLRPCGDIIIRSLKGARLVLLGGEPLEGSRHIYWNFVSSSRQERILPALRLAHAPFSQDAR